MKNKIDLFEKNEKEVKNIDYKSNENIAKINSKTWILRASAQSDESDFNNGE